MSDERKAVFLSYASQDVAAAQRLAEALRAAGVEAWFDRSELRGGDAWDAKIRRQIRDCTLFVPLISRHTEARLEGYFRFEWNLAEQRMLSMAHDAPFLFPVVVDDTSPSTARVPDRFQERQWTRLNHPGAVDEFAARIRSVLSGAAAPRDKSDSASFTHANESVSVTRDRNPGSRTFRWPRILAIAAVVGVIAYFGIRLMSDSSREETPSVSRPAITDERPYYAGSVAVLPFRVEAGDAALAATADRLHEELVGQLGEMKPFDVVSRTSSLALGNSAKSIRDIGRELGAEFVVEGSVQSAGAQPSVTLRVVDVATDHTVFSQTFRTEAGDFESPLARQQLQAWTMAIEIYRRVKAERPPTAEAQERMEKVGTALEQESDEREVRFWGNDGQPRDFGQLEPLLTIARKRIALAPDRPAAHGDFSLFLSQSRTVASDELLLALRRGLHLAPDNFEILRLLGEFYLYRRERPDLAVPFLQKALPLIEADGTLEHNWPYYHLATALDETGQSLAALRVLDRAPHQPKIEHLHYWKSAYGSARQFEQGIEFYRRQLARIRRDQPEAPTFLIESWIAELEAYWSGDSRPILEFVRGLDDEPRATAGFKAVRLFIGSDYAGAIKYILACDPGSDPYAPQGLYMFFMRGLSLLQSGNTQLAQSYLRKALARDDENPGITAYYTMRPGFAHAVAAVAHAVLGNRDDAHAAITEAASRLDPTRNLREYYEIYFLIGITQVQLRETRAACDTIDLLLSSPTGVSVGTIMIDGFFSSLRPAPEYEAVIRKYASQLKDPSFLDRYFARE